MDQEFQITIHRADGGDDTLPATKVVFSPYRCFPLDGSENETACLRALGQHLLLKEVPISFYGAGKFLRSLLKAVPELKNRIQYILDDHPDDRQEIEGVKAIPPDALTKDASLVFLCETRTQKRWEMTRNLRQGLEVISPEILAELDWRLIPKQAWMPAIETIYPLNVPELEFLPGQDMILLDVPARNMALMPNGLGFVHNALKKAGITFQTVDSDIVIYHRFHIHRLLDGPEKLETSAGREIPADPWLTENYDFWGEDDAIGYFQDAIDEIADGIIKARPKILGISVQACNEKFAAAVAEKVKAEAPEIIILVGGFSCYNPITAREAAPYADYAAIFETDLTVGPLVKRLLTGETVTDMPGVISRFDPPDRDYVPGPIPHDLDDIEFPKYEWYGINLYRNWNGYQLTPIIASRGCRWSRCTFCAERFIWRIHSVDPFVDELEWLVSQGCNLFMFNESDLSGMPEKLVEICEEIVRRGIKVRLTGQLRVHKKAARQFFDSLKAAGFVALRFGIDAWSRNTLRLQKKGYTVPMIRQNLEDCWEAGIYTEVNTVVGVPGETEEDTQETIDNIIANKPYIGRIANINPLILANGGVYWEAPEKHNIAFREPKEEIYKKNKRAIPAHLWYSTEPYIDHEVRKDRFERIILALHNADFNVGVWAEKIIDAVKSGSDANRGGKNSDKRAAASKNIQDAVQEAEAAFENLDRKPSEPAMRADSVLGERRVEEPTLDRQIVLQDGTFYAVTTNHDLGAGINDALLKRPSFEVFPVSKNRGQIWLNGALHLALSPRRLAKYGSRAFTTLRKEGLGNLMSKARDYLDWNGQQH